MRIVLKNLKKTYEGVDVVKDVSLSIPSNTVYGIIGKSGAGKSTLVRMVSLLEKPDSGEVWYDDERVDSLDKDGLIARRRRIGMIFQNFNLFGSRSAAGNVAYPLELAGMDKAEISKRVDELLKIVGLEGRGEARISTLSGGQKQRVAIARALANNPDILFCDEATSALDPQTTRQILNLIKEIQKKMQLTVVMITHQMEVVRDCCDFVSVLDEGNIVEFGKAADVFSKPVAAVTKDFIAHLASSEQKDRMWGDKKGQYILRFRGKITDDPVMSRISRELDIDFNIRGGGVQRVGEDEIGMLFVDISGNSDSDIEKAVKALGANGVIVEERK